MGPFGADAMRAWARSLVRDNAYAWNVVDTIVSNVVGDGIGLQSTYETPDGEDVENINDIRDAVCTEWCEVADINGELTFADIQILAQREIVEAGEVLIRFIKTPGKTYKGITRPVPLALEMIEADRIATDRDRLIGNDRENRIVRGIEIDDKGRPVAYWIYPEHPNAAYRSISRDVERIPAGDIRHLYRKDRVGQTRGVSWFAPSMSWLRDLGVYVDNEIQASAVASCFGVAIKTDMPIGGLSAPDGEETSDANGNRLEYLEPAMVTRLMPGESIESINPGRPNSASEPWINLMLRGICAGTGTNYEAIAKDFSKTSYSSSRSSKLEDRPRYKRHQNYMVHHLCIPTWDEFCNAAARAQVDGFPTATELLENRRKVVPVECQLPEQQWVDPQSEQTAAESALNSFTDTYQNVLGARGKTYRQVFYQRAKEERLKRQLGLVTAEQAEISAMAVGAVSGEQQPEVSPSMMGLSTLQWNRNSKAILKTITQLADGTITPMQATVFLSEIGMPDEKIQLLIADAADGTINTPMPAEVVSDGQ